MADRKIASDSLNHIFWIARIWRGIQLLLFSYGLLSININKESHVRPTVRSSRPSQGLSERRSKVLASDTRQCNPSTSRQQKAEGEENQSFAGHVVRQRETQLSLQSYVNSNAKASDLAARNRQLRSMPSSPRLQHLTPPGDI
jgi:hypothetical protein